MTRHPQSADAPEAKKLTADRFITKLRRRDATSGTRLHQALRDAEARFNRREATWRCDLLSDVIESERRAAVAMAHALDLPIDAVLAQDPPQSTSAAPEVDAPDDADVPSRPSLEEYDARGVMEPLSPERVAVGRKR